MQKHICKKCGSKFNYCRGCLLSPIPYHDEGYCSKACQDADKVKEIIPKDVEVIETNEDTSTSNEEVEMVSSFFLDNAKDKKIGTVEHTNKKSTNNNEKKKE